MNLHPIERAGAYALGLSAILLIGVGGIAVWGMITAFHDGAPALATAALVCAAPLVIVGVAALLGGQQLRFRSERRTRGQ
jgi:hypothetical protein